MMVTYQVRDGIAEAVIDNPPVNTLSAGVRTGLENSLRRFEADESALALVIRAAGRTFPVGADITEFGRPAVPPGLPEFLKTFDQLGKPIVAALHGTVLGGGLELALACHYRIAIGTAQLGFPEVKLGLLPGAGGTQRAPRLMGLAASIPFITEGKSIGAATAFESGLIDAIAEGDLIDEARIFARRLIDEGRGARSVAGLPMPTDDPALFDAARISLGRKLRGQEAPLRALDAIRLGYTYPFVEALDREYDLCRYLVAGPQSRALRHVFAAEREVAKIPRLPAEIMARPIGRAGVIGLGVMGRGITVALASAGVPVVAVSRDGAHRDSAMAAITKQWAAAVAKGSLVQAEMDNRLALISPSAEVSALADVDLVIEAVSEAMAAKRGVFAALGAATRPGTILASNTSYLDIDALAEASGRPEDVCGMHFFNPAPVMRLLENVRARRTDDEVVATIMAFGKRIGKLPILTGVCDGFVVNRMLAKRSRESYFLLEEGATPQAIDRVVEAFGFPMGPYALADLAGIDVQYAAREARRDRLSPRERRADFVDQMYALGRYGQKSGHGWYRYGDDRKRTPDPETDAIIARHAERHGLLCQPIEDSKIRDRLLFAMVNEGARIIGEGIVPRPHEIDVAMIAGLGFPSFTGGPMFWADQLGLPIVLDTIQRFGREHGEDYWSPAPLLVEHVGQGRGFYA